MSIAARHLIPIGCCAAFLLLGFQIAHYPGLQYDEALFGQQIYPPRIVWASVSFLRWKIPIMQSSYIGALKSWIYTPIFKLWPPYIISIRLPVLLLATLTLALFFLLLKRTLGRRAATAGVLLLATDTSFLFTSCFDWGPVVLQHLFMGGAMLALTVFWQEEKQHMLALGFLLLGLGLWDKALFLWVLVALAVATFIVFGGELRCKISSKRVVLAVCSFVLGSFPLIYYNVQKPLDTFRSNARLSAVDFRLKVRMLRTTLDGSFFFGYMVNDQEGHDSKAPSTSAERFSEWLDKTTLSPHRNLTIPALVACTSLLPLFWRTPAKKPVLFSLIFLCTIWSQMLIVQGGGLGPHHIVLMWPIPFLLLAAVLKQISDWSGKAANFVLLGMLVILVGSNTLLTNTYWNRLAKEGAAGSWNNAIFPLSDYLLTTHPRTVYTADWGILNSLRLLGRGELPLNELCYQLRIENLSTTTQQSIVEKLSATDYLLVGHTTQFEVFPGISKRLSELELSHGFRKQTLTRINDSNGRAVFEVFRFRNSAQ
jgi:4-amino-4-deoxy-L-arabinose transferase-like glycosyltransferase